MDKQERDYLGFSPSEYRKFKSHSWRYLILFSLLYCFLYCTRLNISSATPYLTEGGWSESTIGLMTGALFWTYGIGQLISGRLSELVGPARLIIIAVVLSAAANFLVALQEHTSILLLTILWGANGIFQSMGWSPGLAALTKWWPGKSRGFAVGFLNAFSGFGQAAAYGAILAAYTWLPQLGWKAGFVVPPLFSLAVLLLYLLGAKPTPASAGLKDYAESNPDTLAAEQQMLSLSGSRGPLYPYKYLLRNRRFLLWVLIAFCAGLARYGLSTWIPLYFTRQGFSAAASVASAVILPVGMGIGTLVVPWLTDRFCPENRMPAAIISALAGAAATVFIFVLDASSPLQLILVECLLFLSGFCIYAINGILFTYAADVGGRVFSGTCSGLLNFSAYLGAAVQSIVYGFVLEHSGWGIVFLSIAAFNLLIAVLGFWGIRRNSQ